MKSKYLLIPIALTIMIVFTLGIECYVNKSPLVVWLFLVAFIPLIFGFLASIGGPYEVRDNHFFVHSKYNDERLLKLKNQLE